MLETTKLWPCLLWAILTSYFIASFMIYAFFISTCIILSLSQIPMLRFMPRLWFPWFLGDRDHPNLALFQRDPIREDLLRCLILIRFQLKKEDNLVTSMLRCTCYLKITSNPHYIDNTLSQEETHKQPTNLNLQIL